MFWDILMWILLTIFNYLWITTLIDIIVTGFPALRLEKRLEKTAFLIERENHSEVQGASECSAFASAYVYRHFGREAKGMELYEEMPWKFPGGSVSCRGIVKLARKYGFAAGLRAGTLTALKNAVAKGTPVIVLIRSGLGKTTMHFVPVVGYNEEYIFIMDSVRSSRNHRTAYYNRRVPTKEFCKLWNVSMLRQPFYRNLFIEISEEERVE